jgi:hypothetical protein
MSLQDVANKVFKKYGGLECPEFNLESLDSSISRWTNFRHISYF